jgi:polyisoprenoid-binding protein YceI
MKRVVAVGAAAVLALTGAGLLAVGTRGGLDGRGEPVTGMAGDPFATTRDAGESLGKATAAATYEVDPVHSSVHFMIRHAGIANFYGRFNEFSGSLTLDPENPDSSSLEFTVGTGSVDTANEGRDEHLRSGDFFNARQFPEATFASRSFAAGAEEGLWTIEGDLTLHGETGPVTVTLDWLGTGEMRGATIGAFEATFEFKRSDFGMATYLADDGGEGGPLGNTVRMLVSVEATRQ